METPSSPDVSTQTSQPIPLGVYLVAKCRCSRQLSLKSKLFSHRLNVLVLTFLAYAAYHLARKPTSVSKNVLHRNCSGVRHDPSINITSDVLDTWCNWVPFDGNDGDTLLGVLDSVFLFAYAIGMYLTGSLAERVNLRYFLCGGMLLSGIFAFLFGLAYWTDIHTLPYFIVVQMLAGLAQSTGWPGCVAAVGNWFGKSKRGLIMGIWRSHHSVGNMLGSLIAAQFVEYDWGLSFAVPAVILVFLAVLLFLFLVPDPRDVGLPIPDYSPPTEVELDCPPVKSVQATANVPELPELPNTTSVKPPDVCQQEQPINFFRALLIPGVVEYSVCLFFSKLINYTFLYWLPRYIKESGLHVGDKVSANFSTLFDIGGIFGGIAAGVVSDMTGMSAIPCAGASLLSLPMLYVFLRFGGDDVAVSLTLLLILGFLINVPYALITTSVSADLGTRSDLRKSNRALATVTAIIDGTGSIGAAVGPLMAGPLSRLGWEYVFYTLMISSGLGALLLVRLIKNEIKQVLPRKLSFADANRYD